MRIEQEPHIIGYREMIRSRRRSYDEGLKSIFQEKSHGVIEPSNKIFGEILTQQDRTLVHEERISRAVYETLKKYI